MSSYAKATTVPIDRSKAEIERLLASYGADQFLYAWDNDDAVAVLSFRFQGRYYRFRLPLPRPDDLSFAFTPVSKQPRSKQASAAQYDRAVKARWRALVLVLKAKLVAIDEGIVTFDDEFLSYTVLPDGSTIGQWAQDQIEDVYRTNQMPSLLPGASREVLRLADSQREST